MHRICCGMGFHHSLDPTASAKHCNAPMPRGGARRFVILDEQDGDLWCGRGVVRAGVPSERHVGEGATEVDGIRARIAHALDVGLTHRIVNLGLARHSLQGRRHRKRGPNPPLTGSCLHLHIGIYEIDLGLARRGTRIEKEASNTAARRPLNSERVNPSKRGADCGNYVGSQRGGVQGAVIRPNLPSKCARSISAVRKQRSQPLWGVRQAAAGPLSLGSITSTISDVGGPVALAQWREAPLLATG